VEGGEGVPDGLHHVRSPPSPPSSKHSLFRAHRPQISIWNFLSFSSTTSGRSMVISNLGSTDGEAKGKEGCHFQNTDNSAWVARGPKTRCPQGHAEVGHHPHAPPGPRVPYSSTLKEWLFRSTSMMYVPRAGSAASGRDRSTMPCRGLTSRHCAMRFPLGSCTQGHAASAPRGPQHSAIKQPTAALRFSCPSQGAFPSPHHPGASLHLSD